MPVEFEITQADLARLRLLELINSRIWPQLQNLRRSIQEKLGFGPRVEPGLYKLDSVEVYRKLVTGKALKQVLPEDEYEAIMDLVRSATYVQLRVTKRQIPSFDEPDDPVVTVSRRKQRTPR